MLNQKLANHYADNFEKKVKGILEKYGLAVNKIDNKKFSCPDFLVTNGSGDKVLIECKYIASAGIAPDGKTHISNLDPNLPESGDIPVVSSINNQREALEDAQKQYLDLIINKPKYINTPFVVALGYDFFANFFNIYPNDFNDLTELSAIMTLERDVEIKESLMRLSHKDLMARIDDQSNAGLPQPSIRFKVIINKKVTSKFIPDQFLRNPIVH